MEEHGARKFLAPSFGPDFATLEVSGRYRR
jgi:hypothetical protein